MQKVVAFLEKNVQWVAIALGAAFLLWMIYGFVVQKPVTVPVAGTPLTPGQVDDKTLTGPGRQLEALTKGTSAPAMPVQEFLTALQTAFGNVDAPKAPLASAWTSNFYAATETQIEKPEQIREVPKDPVVQLPVAPAPTDLKTSDGRSTVTIPLPAMAGAPPAPPVPGSGVDVNWITVGSTIPVKKLAENFKTSKIPQTIATNMTTLLHVELDREEQNGDGTWGNSTTIEPLKNVTLLPLPAANASPEQGIAYRIWAESEQVDIAQPAMYPVIQGDAWRIPGGQIPQDTAALAAAAAFDPSKVTSTRDLTPDQRKQYDAYQRQLEQAKRDAARQKYLSRKGGGGGGAPPPGIGGPGGPGGPGGGGGGQFGGGGGDVAVDDSAPVLLAQVPPGYGRMPGGYPGGMPGGYPGMPNQFSNSNMPPGAIPGMGMPGMPQPGAANQAVDSANAALLTAAQSTLPKGSFNPAEQPDIIVWAHDTTVLPGKTYRYRVRYYLKNPVFQTTNVCKTADLENQFMLTSDYSDWTDGISVKSVTNFYAVNTSPTKDSVKFDIFRWKNGNWQVNTIDATPGDMVGAPKGEGADKIDFSTGWTLVDVRNDPRNVDNKIIILTTDNGQTLRKDLSTDRASNEYKNLKSQVDAAKAASAGNPANPAAPGAPRAPSQNALINQFSN